MNINLLLVAQLLLAAALMWSCFCRMVRTDHDTAREIRWAFLFHFIAAGFAFSAPWLPLVMPDVGYWKPGSTPRWVWVALLGSMSVVELATAKLWLQGKAQARFTRSPTLRAAFGMATAGLVALMVAAPRLSIAQAERPAPAESSMAHMAPGQRFQCTHSAGCIVLTPTALGQLLHQANGTCGRIPSV